ncbi:O-antigen ligase family protein [Novosphingobium sp. BL-8A]|uniref:O-antigen ligase family protein n=1 Tax=Novosphingobium sp. BL-8A TaxID=3127639 RepID=UPI003757A9E0
MPVSPRPARRVLPSPAFSLLTLFMAMLLVAGGASRADVYGQAVIRGSAAALMTFCILMADRREFAVGSRAVYLFALLSLGLPLLQLVPMPPSLWEMLPSHKILLQAVHGPQPWRPLAIVPDAAINAAASLLVPLAALVLNATLPASERNCVATLILAFIVCSTLVGLLQLSGAGIDNPLINDVRGAVSGPFANRNHFALLLAIGGVLTPLWAFRHGEQSLWRLPVAIVLCILFFLLILATGSRAGIVLGALGVAAGLAIEWSSFNRILRRVPQRMRLLICGAGVAFGALLITISIYADRVQSINRAMSLNAADDMRVRGFATVLSMVRTGFPYGNGFGSFEPLFRLNEPDHLLKPTYFNHAHNDFIEIVHDGGVIGLLLLITALGWWAWASIRAWRLEPSPSSKLARTGSIILGLVFLASIVDYPARTPIIMTISSIAALWLAWARGTKGTGRFTLP